MTTTMRPAPEIRNLLGNPILDVVGHGNLSFHNHNS